MEDSNLSPKITGFTQIKANQKPNHEHGHHGHSHHHHHSKTTQTKKIFLRIAHSNSYISIPILAITLSTYLQLGLFKFDINYLGFLFFSTLLLYPLHRFIGIKMTIPVEFTKSQREVNNHPRLIYFALGLGLIGSLYFTLQLDYFTVQLLAPLAIISLTYSIPIIPTNNGWKRLRDIPGIKIFAISLVVSFTTSTIPLLMLNEVSGTDIVFLGVQRFLFILAITIPFDVRDVRLDEKWKLKTIPLMLGNEKSMKLAVILVNLASVVALFQFLVTDAFGIHIVVAILISNLWATFILHKFRENNSPLYNAFLVEGLMVVQFALVTIVSVGITLF